MKQRNKFQIKINPASNNDFATLENMKKEKMIVDYIEQLCYFRITALSGVAAHDKKLVVLAEKIYKIEDNVKNKENFTKIKEIILKIRKKEDFEKVLKKNKTTLT